MRTVAALLFFSSLAVAAPDCGTNLAGPVDTRLRLLSGKASGFDAAEPIFVTVTTGEKKYTTQANKDGNWEVLYGNFSGDSRLLCWQGFPDSDTAAVGHP